MKTEGNKRIPWFRKLNQICTFTCLNQSSFKNCIRKLFYVNKKQFKKVKTEVTKARNKPCAHTVLVKSKPNPVKLTKHARENNVWANIDPKIITSSHLEHPNQFLVTLELASCSNYCFRSVLFRPNEVLLYCVMKKIQFLISANMQLSSLNTWKNSGLDSFFGPSFPLFNLNVREEKMRNTIKLCCGT